MPALRVPWRPGGWWRVQRHSFARAAAGSRAVVVLVVYQSPAHVTNSERNPAIPEAFGLDRHLESVTKSG